MDDVYTTLYNYFDTEIAQRGGDFTLTAVKLENGNITLAIHQIAANGVDINLSINKQTYQSVSLNTI